MANKYLGKYYRAQIHKIKLNPIVHLADTQRLIQVILFPMLAKVWEIRYPHMLLMRAENKTSFPESN